MLAWGSQILRRGVNGGLIGREMLCWGERINGQWHREVGKENSNLPGGKLGRNPLDSKGTKNRNSNQHWGTQKKVACLRKVRRGRVRGKVLKALIEGE